MPDGGYGDPRQRPAEAVLADVLDGKVSADFVRREFGVAIRGGAVDRGETDQLRVG